MAQQHYNLYYAILPVKLSNMNVLMFHLTNSQFFYTNICENFD